MSKQHHEEHDTGNINEQIGQSRRQAWLFYKKPLNTSTVKLLIWKQKEKKTANSLRHVRSLKLKSQVWRALNEQRSIVQVESVESTILSGARHKLLLKKRFRSTINHVILVIFINIIIQSELHMLHILFNLHCLHYPQTEIDQKRNESDLAMAWLWSPLRHRENQYSWLFPSFSRL